MDEPILFLVISIAIVLCLVILNCLTDNETFMNKIKGNGETLHGGYHIPGKENELKNKQTMDCGGKYKLTHSEKYFVPKDEELQLKDIVERLLGKINKDLNLHFKFVEFDQITKQQFNDGNKRYLLDTFIHEVHNFYNRRLIIDIFINSKVIVNKITLANARKEQPIYKLEDYDFNRKIESNLNLKKNDKLLGKINSTLEFNLLDYQPKEFKNKDFKKWILPKDYLDYLNKNNNEQINVWPCREQKNYWDENGVHLTVDYSKICNGVNSSYQETIKEPKFQPNFKNINEESENNWLFGTYKMDGTKAFMGGRGHGVN